MNSMLRALALSGVTFTVACSGGDGMNDDDKPPPPPKETDCSIETTIDATSMEAWIYFDLESGEIVTPANPDDSTEWDIAFQRFKVKSNGGTSGTGGVEVAMIEGVACNDLLEAPAAGYRVDEPDGEDVEEIPDYAISFGPSSETGPWAYDATTHQLFDSETVWVVKTVEDGYFKLHFVEYYGPGGTPGMPTFEWKKVDAPKKQLPMGAIEVSTSLMGYTYLDIDDGVITVSSPESSTDWDVAVSGPAWQTNGGLGRAGVGGARLADSSDYDAVTTAPTVGYAIDADIPYPGPPGAGNYDGNPTLVDWFEYDMTDHTAQPLDVVFLIRGGDGSYGKLRILEYEEHMDRTQTYVLKLDPVTREVETNSDSIVSDATAFTYYNLRLGTEVDPDDPSASLDWDLGLSRTRIRTNGGTSGAGQGGAAGPIDMPLDMITDVPATFEVDGMIDDPESPGTQYSGNPILADWYEGTQTSTTPKDTAFVIKTADGGYAKLKISGWNNGTFDVDWAYAGPGNEAF